MWKFHNFSTSQILREITYFWDSNIIKYAVFAILEELISGKKTEWQKNPEICSLWIGNNTAIIHMYYLVGNTEQIFTCKKENP